MAYGEPDKWYAKLAMWFFAAAFFGGIPAVMAWNFMHPDPKPSAEEISKRENVERADGIAHKRWESVLDKRQVYFDAKTFKCRLVDARAQISPGAWRLNGDYIHIDIGGTAGEMHGDYYVRTMTQNPMLVPKSPDPKLFDCFYGISDSD